MNSYDQNSDINSVYLIDQNINHQLRLVVDKKINNKNHILAAK